MDEDIQAADEGAQIAFEELAYIDLDDLDEIPDEGLYEHFSGLASRASEGQLRQVLGIGTGDDLFDLASLVHQYASGRSSLAARMRALR